ncbi:hypothetical protein K493DRAFT_305711 [Basidiobolus meristosporus CBS 931.73]|uniref:CRIB domain-containing protein n=1 Tax=Basidiobolus meristosporus CBS 931.73 TaxID=1314790 RepID=A0A1Y1XUU7_9FUNG|nr:hypothetical protein K493DRAFT_305711 [Basidiobolus meristosporus CBS 931.73]|eukprot:ORX89493.1 hypothetical protein K493DRAFT_305711 [Basidiobolus meristosporus CBS 931.73]
MASYEVDWVAPLAGPIHPPKHISLPPAWRKREAVNHGRMRKSKSQYLPDAHIRWSKAGGFNDEPAAHPEKSKTNRFSTIIQSMGNLLKRSRKMDISSPFNFLHCGHAGVDPITQEIVGLPTNSLNLVPLDQITTSYLDDKPLPPTPDESVTPRTSTPTPKSGVPVYDRAKLKRSTTCINSPSIQRDSGVRWSLQSNRDERQLRRASSLRSSMYSPRNRKNLEISSPFNPIHVAHISFTKEGALVAMPLNWRQSLAYEL